MYMQIRVSVLCKVTLAETQCVCYKIRTESFNIILVTLESKWLTKQHDF